MTAISQREALDAMVAAIVEQLDQVAEWAEGLDDEMCVELLSIMAKVKASVSGVETAAKNRLLALTAAGEVVAVPGYGQAIHRAGAKQTTLGVRLAMTLAARVADTRPPANEDGEPLPPAEWCRLTAEEFVAVFGLANASVSFRKKEVEDRGLRPGDFVDWTDGTPKIEFVDGSR